MRRQAIDSLAAWPADVVVPRGVLVLSGYGLDVRVWRGRLRIADGVGRQRRTAIIHRATGGLRRLVVLGHTGTLTLDAIRWLADVGAGYIQVDEDGRVLAAFGPLGTDRPGLRRAQARALDTTVGNDIVRALLAEKIAGQAEALVELDRRVPVADAVVESIRVAGARLHVATTRDDLRLAEAQAAAAYWSAWSGVSLAFARRDLARIPGHWRTFGTRSSPLTGSPRLAGNPANAVLNYLYALLEGESAIAARVVGLDPGLGFLHADQLNRDSLAADLMEPVRPLVDRYALRLFSERTFASADFYETRQGVCRVTPGLATELAATSPEWRARVGRVAEDVARLLDEGALGGRPVPTPVSGRNRSAGRGGLAKRRRSASGSTVRRACAWCGGAVAPGRRTCSAECRAAVEGDNRPAFVAAGADALADRREQGWRPVLSTEGRDRMLGRTTNAIRGAREWQRTHEWPADPTEFERDILPGLVDLSARELARRTGLSASYCGRIKQGHVVPHPMWWEKLVDAVGEGGAGADPGAGSLR